MINLSFEYGAKERQPRIIRVDSDWLQITYSEIRDHNDTMLAYQDCTGLWRDAETDCEWSDVVISHN